MTKKFYGHLTYLLLSLILSVMFFAGCAQDLREADGEQQPEPISTYQQAAAMYTFIDSLPESELPRPLREVENFDDLIYVLDYLAFYRINDKIAFDVSPQYMIEVYNINSALSDAMAVCSLAQVYPASYDGTYYKQFGIFAVTLKCKDYATNQPVKGDRLSAAPFNYGGSVKDGRRADGYDGFYINTNNKGSVSVQLSEQLWYAVSKGYKPVPEKGSMAETIYDKAKDVLRDRITDTMTDAEKAKAIYDYLSVDVKYDYETFSSSGRIWEKEQCYFLEGVFLNEYAVCDGTAKAYSLLAGMEGIQIYRVTAGNSVGKHAYNYIFIDGKWYLSCTTYSKPQETLKSDGKKDVEIILPSYNMFLTTLETPFEEDWNFMSLMHTDISEKIEKEPYDYIKNTSIETGSENVNLEIDKSSKALNIVNAFYEKSGSLKNISFEFRLKRGVTASDITDTLSSAYGEYDLRYLKQRPKGDNIYIFVFL